MKHRNFHKLLAGCAFAAIPTIALAQVADPAPAAGSTAPAAASSGSSSSSSDIVVTARRREESVQTVPIAITAFSQKSLERKSIFNAFDLSKAVPGLTVNAENGVGTQGDFSIRGRGLSFGASSGSVASYFADVPINSNFAIPGLPPQFFDLQSVQVLKGPQGTLFGRNTTGGAVLFVPQAPTDDFGGYARVQGGSYDDLQVEGAVNLPFSDKVMLRVAGFEWHRKGYTRTTGGYVDPYGQLLPVQRYDNQDVTEVRATLLLKPTDSLTNSTIVTYHTDSNRGDTQVIGINPKSATGLAIAAVYPGFATDGPRVTATDVNLDRSPSSTYAIINTTTFEVSDSLTIKNIFGYINASGFVLNPGEADGSPLPIVDLPRQPRQLKNRQTTDEIQFQGNLFENRLTWIAGGIIDLTRQPGGNDLNIFTNSYQGGSWDEQFRQDHYTSKSVFGSATFKITDKFSISGGIRSSWDTIKDTQCEYSPVTPASSAADCIALKGLDIGSHKFQGLSYNGSLEYRPTNGTMLYGGYRHGYKRGGFNSHGGSTLELFAPEKVDDFYAGVKKDLHFGGMTGHFNIEGFWDLYKDAQRSYLGFDPVIGALSTIITNAPKMTYRGFDADFVVEATPWLELSGNYTFVDAFYRSFPDTSCANGLCLTTTGFVPVAQIQAINPGDQGSNPVGLNSRNKFSVTARLHTDLSDGGELAFAPSYSYQSKWFFNDNAYRQPNSSAALFGAVNSAAAGAELSPGYGLLDFRVEWNKVRGSNFDLAFNANNVLNKAFITGGSGIYQLGFNNVSYGAPRMFTVEAKVHF